MRVLLLIITITLLIILQLGLQHLGWVNSVPNLVLIYLCLLLSVRSFHELWGPALGAGVLLDILSGLPDGVFAVSIPASLAFADYVGSVTFDKAHDFVVPIRVFAASLAFAALSLLVMAVLNLVFLNRVVDLVQVAWPDSILRFFYDLIFIVPVYFVFFLQTKILKALGPKYESV
jgi:hypothetical protein